MGPTTVIQSASRLAAIIVTIAVLALPGRVAVAQVCETVPHTPGGGQDCKTPGATCGPNKNGKCTGGSKDMHAVCTCEIPDGPTETSFFVCSSLLLAWGGLALVKRRRRNAT